MPIGLLWYDDDPKRPISEKVRDAAARYRVKFGQSADHAIVNPAEQAGITQVDGITVESDRYSGINCVLVERSCGLN